MKILSYVSNPITAAKGYVVDAMGKAANGALNKGISLFDSSSNIAIKYVKDAVTLPDEGKYASSNAKWYILINRRMAGLAVIASIAYLGLQFLAFINTSIYMVVPLFMLIIATSAFAETFAMSADQAANQAVIDRKDRERDQEADIEKHRITTDADVQVRLAQAKVDEANAAARTEEAKLEQMREDAKSRDAEIEHNKAMAKIEQQNEAMKIVGSAVSSVLGVAAKVVDKSLDELLDHAIQGFDNTNSNDSNKPTDTDSLLSEAIKKLGYLQNAPMTSDAITHVVQTQDRICIR